MGGGPFEKKSGIVQMREFEKKTKGELEDEDSEED
jgi:hypothetical protein